MESTESGAEAKRRARLPLVRLVMPARAQLDELPERMRMSKTLVAQLQRLELAPGVVRAGEQLLVRIDVPCPNEGYGIAWKRVDILASEHALIVVQAERLDEVGQVSEERDAAELGRLLADIVHAVVRKFDALRESLEREEAAIGSGTTATRKALRVLHQDSAELSRGIDAALGCLSRLLDEHVLDAQERADVIASMDRLRALSAAMEALRLRLPPAPVTASEELPSLDVESPEIVETAIALGQRRLHRIAYAHALTALIGGLAVSFGAVAMAWVGGPFLESSGYERAHLLGSVAFPVGFIILIIGKGELFTENFFVPVTGVLGRRGHVKDLLQLWSSTLLFNLVGGVIFGWLITRRGVLADGAKSFLVTLGEHTVSATFWPSFMKAVFAGWLMTLLTWLLLSAREQGPRLAIIYLIGFLIAVGQLNHVVISASEAFIAIGAGGEVTVKAWLLRSFLPALTGNLAGGLVFVTVLGYLQAHVLEESEKRMRDTFHQRAKSEGH